MVNNESQCSWKWKLASIDGNQHNPILNQVEKGVN
jgi:hypothetical protein